MSEKECGLYFLLVSVHGLIRGRDLELGRDADTGGQTLYVVELSRAGWSFTHRIHVSSEGHVNVRRHGEVP